MAKDVHGAYEQLIRQARELAVLSSCSALLHWDEQTYMPRGGSAHRGEQMAHLAGLHHERRPIPGSVSCWPSSGAPTWWPIPNRRRPSMSVSCAGTMNERPGCRATWWKRWPEPPRWPSKSGSRPGVRDVLSVSARGWRKLSSSNVRKRPA